MAGRTPDYEFFGPYIGPVAIILGLPAICIGLVAACNQSGCTNWSLAPPRPPDDWRLFDKYASAAVLGWILFQACLWLVLPGKKAQGVVLTDGRRLKYKLTGVPCHRTMRCRVGSILLHTIWQYWTGPTALADYASDARQAQCALAYSI